MKIGITFDYEQCTNLGLDYKEALNMTNKLEIKIVRIGLKWSKIETKRGKYNWGIYDEILNYLDKENIEVVLCLGMKSPRWPEFFIPKWLEYRRFNGFRVLSSNDVLRSSLFEFFERAIKRYSKLENIKYLQIENEPFLKAGPKKGKIGTMFLVEELSFLRTITNLPIILNAQGLPTTGVLAEYLKGKNDYKKKLIELCDIFGVNVYEKFEDKTFLGLQRTFRAGIFTWRYLGRLIDYAETHKKSVFVTELQAEPWQFGNVSLKDPYANKTCNPKMVRNNLKKLEEVGIESILLWGFEFHIACKREGNDEWVRLLYNN